MLLFKGVKRSILWLLRITLSSCSDCESPSDGSWNDHIHTVMPQEMFCWTEICNVCSCFKKNSITGVIKYCHTVTRRIFRKLSSHVDLPSHQRKQWSISWKMVHASLFRGVTINSGKPRMVISYKKNVVLLSIMSSNYLMSLHVNIFCDLKFFTKKWIAACFFFLLLKLMSHQRSDNVSLIFTYLYKQ